MSLIHYWPLDEASGNTPADIVGGSTGFLEMTPGVIPGLFGNARDMSANTIRRSSLKLSSGAESSATIADWSLACAIKEGANSPTLTLTTLWEFAANGIALRHERSTGRLVFEHWVDFVPIQETEYVVSGLMDGSWHWIVVRANSASTEIFIDGALIASIAGARALAPLSQGASLGGGTNCDVAIEEVAIFNHCLSDAEVALIGSDTMDNLGSSPEPEPFIEPEGPIQIYYAAELRGGGSVLRLPISSWQATLQTGRLSYLQCVVPAAEQYIDAITAAGLLSTLVVIRGAILPDGSTAELDMAAVPLQQMPYQRGPQRSTVTLSGYGSINFAVVDPDAPPAGSVRTLTGVQTISVDQGGNRARAQIDWLLRPGMIADVDGTQFQVAWINYYANRSQEFMDVGSRAL